MAGAVREPRDRPCRALAAGAEARLLHDRLGGARVERLRRARAAAVRPRAAPLPLGRFLPRARRASRARRRARRPARDGGGGRGADRRRPSQGVRPPRARSHPADVDDRLASAACGRDRVRDRARARHRRRLHMARGRSGRLLVRRRLAEPRDGPGGSQHRRPARVRRPAAASAVRLRGQRPRDQRAHPRGVGRAVAARTSRAGSRARRGGRPGGRSRDRARAR